jgi:hypothetical protein
LEFCRDSLWCGCSPNQLKSTRLPPTGATSPRATTPCTWAHNSTTADTVGPQGAPGVDQAHAAPRPPGSLLAVRETRGRGRSCRCRTGGSRCGFSVSVHHRPPRPTQPNSTKRASLAAGCVKHRPSAPVSFADLALVL